MNYILDGIDNIMDHGISIDEVLGDTPNIKCLGTSLEDICNYKCVYCYAGDIERKKQSSLLLLPEYFSLFEQAKQLGCNSVIITGALSMAEPLMSKNLIPVMEKLKELNLTPIMFTNGSLFGDDNQCRKIHGISGEDMIEIMYKCNVSLMVSCDSLDEQSYNSIVAAGDNAFKNFKKALDRVKDSSYANIVRNDEKFITKVAFSVVISKINYNQLSDMRAFCHQNSWQFICKFPSLMGNANTNRRLFFSTSEVETLKNEIESLTDKVQTLSIYKGSDRYCLMNQLGIAINNVGQPLTCLSDRVAFEEEGITIKNTSLEDIVQLKKKIFGCSVGACPKKTKYYK